MASSSGSTTSTNASPLKKARSSGDACSNALDALQISALSDLVTHLQDSPHTILPTLHWVQKADFDRASKPTSGEPPFHSTYRKLYRIPKDFLRGFLPDLVGQDSALTSDSISLLEKGEDGVARKLFFYATNTSTDTAWPQHAHDKGIFRSTFLAAANSHGNRLHSIVMHKDGLVMKVNWKQWGCYVLTPLDKCEKTKILHVATGTEADLDEVVKSYEVRENWHHLKAQIKLKRSWTNCVDYFEAEFKTNRISSYRDNKATLHKLASAAYAKLPESKRAPLAALQAGKSNDSLDDEEDDARPPAGLPSVAKLVAKRTA